MSIGIQTRSQRAMAMSCDSEVSEVMLPVKILKLVVSDIQNILEVGEGEQEPSSSEDEDVSHTNNTV